jgi:hypothetical protein
MRGLEDFATGPDGFDQLWLGGETILIAEQNFEHRERDTEMP